MILVIKISRTVFNYQKNIKFSMIILGFKYKKEALQNINKKGIVIKKRKPYWALLRCMAF